MCTYECASPVQAGSTTPGSALLTEGTYLTTAVWGASSYVVVSGARGDPVTGQSGTFTGGLSGTAAAGGPGSSATATASALSTAGWAGVVVAMFFGGAIVALFAAWYVLRAQRLGKRLCLSSKPLFTSKPASSLDGSGIAVVTNPITVAVASHQAAATDVATAPPQRVASEEV